MTKTSKKEKTKDQYRELLIGCGTRREKIIQLKDRTEWHNLTTLDIMESHNPDVVWDLNNLPLPFKDNYFDEIHAYEVLEHCGQQGDYKFFFNQFSDFWRILKPKGVICITVPAKASMWVWGDPGHTRVIAEETVAFLSQKIYDQVGDSPITDYREIYKADFEAIYVRTNYEIQQLHLVLEAIKKRKPNVRNTRKTKRS